jgi:4'-phosphopantetheinyl transferase
MHTARVVSTNTVSESAGRFSATSLTKYAPTQLREGEVQLWRADVTNTEAWSRSFEVLSEDERIRADDYRFDSDRYRFMARRSLLRHLIASYLTTEPKEIRFQYGSFGKPSIDIGTSTPKLHFNLSFSGDRVMYAFSLGRRVGIDIERIRPIADSEQVAKRHFSTQELDLLRRARPSQWIHAFLGVWTRKEAVVKALGMGFGLPLDSFGVVEREDHQYEIVGGVRNARRCRIIPVDAGTGFIAALCVDGPEFSLASYTLAEAPEF